MNSYSNSNCNSYSNFNSNLKSNAKTKSKTNSNTNSNSNTPPPSLAPTSLGLVQPVPLLGEVSADRDRRKKREFLNSVLQSNRTRIRAAGGCQVRRQVLRGWTEALEGLQ